MNFDSDRIMVDIYDDEVRGLVERVVNSSAGASVVLARGRTIRDFRAKLAALGEAGRKQLTERYVGITGKRYENDSWRGLWDRILDTSFAMDGKGNHRARSMAKYGEFLEVAEAIEARSADAVPGALIVYSRAFTDLQRRARDATQLSDKEKLLAAISKAMVAAFDEIGGKRRVSGNRADAAIVDAAIVEECAESGIDVVAGVVQPKQSTKSVKRGREMPGDGEGAAGADATSPPEQKVARTIVMDDIEAMEKSMGKDRAHELIRWFVRQTSTISDSVAVSNLSLFTGELEEYEEEMN